MNVLLVSATALEIRPFLQWLKQEGSDTKRPPDVLIAGIGLTATSYHLTKQLSLKKYDLVIQAGIAGCFDKETVPGETVCVKKDLIADQGVIEQKQLKTVFDLELASPNQPPYNKGWLENPHKALMKKTGLRLVDAISVNEISTSRMKMDLYRNRFAPIVESMEGAALHYICLQEGIPFLQLRSISNYVGERNKAKWKLKESISSLNQTLINLIEQL